MARRSLRPHLNQIRGWVRQGRTDAWIAHQLEVTVQQIEAFKKENDLVPDGDTEGAPVPGAGGGDFDDEIDLRAEDDALIAAELEAAEAARAEEEERRAAEAAAARPTRTSDDDDEDEDEDEDEDAAASAAAGAAVGAAGARAPRASSRAPSTTARRDTGCGSTPPSRTTPSTPSTGPATAP